MVFGGRVVGAMVVGGRVVGATVSSAKVVGGSVVGAVVVGGTVVSAGGHTKFVSQTSVCGLSNVAPPQANSEPATIPMLKKQ